MPQQALLTESAVCTLGARRVSVPAHGQRARNCPHHSRLWCSRRAALGAGTQEVEAAEVKTGTRAHSTPKAATADRGLSKNQHICQRELVSL